MERVKGDGLAWPKREDNLCGWAGQKTTALRFAEAALEFFFAETQLSVAITDLTTSLAKSNHY